MKFPADQKGAKLMLAMKIVFSLLIISSLTTWGCASQLRARPEELISVPSYTMNSAMTRSIKITVNDFSLKTGKPANQIGEAKTGVFNVPTPITFEQPPNVIISNAIKKGLSSVGSQLTETGEADYILDGTVETFWVDEYATGISLEYAKAGVGYDVILKSRNGKILWATTIESFKTSGKSLDATADDLPTLRAALDDSISKLLENVSFWNALAQ